MLTLAACSSNFFNTLAKTCMMIVKGKKIHASTFDPVFLLDYTQKFELESTGAKKKIIIGGNLGSQC